jgi:hypothetical protein
MHKQMAIIHLLLFVFVAILALSSRAQETGLKGNVFVFWGWNRECYTHCDLRMKGNGYDFTLHDVRASDRQSTFSLDTYMNPANLTIPQTNFKAGYFISDHYSVSAGFDHMKYVMVQDQTVRISGEINVHGSPYNGIYDDDEIVLTRSFLQYEHTDGLNYIHAGLSRYDKLFDIHAIRTSIYISEGADAGIVMPRSAVRFMNQELSDYYHIAGYGLNLEAGIGIVVFKVITFRSEVKGGFIHLPDVRISNSKTDKASQHFLWLQGNVLIGATIPLIAGNH